MFPFRRGVATSRTTAAAHADLWFDRSTFALGPRGASAVPCLGVHWNEDEAPEVTCGVARRKVVHLPSPRGPPVGAEVRKRCRRSRLSNLDPGREVAIISVSAVPVGRRHAPVAQLDRALPSGGRGHRFESCRAYREDPGGAVALGSSSLCTVDSDVRFSGWSPGASRASSRASQCPGERDRSSSPLWLSSVPNARIVARRAWCLAGGGQIDASSRVTLPQQQPDLFAARKRAVSSGSAQGDPHPVRAGHALHPAWDIFNRRCHQASPATIDALPTLGESCGRPGYLQGNAGSASVARR